ncbi:MAG TPA: alpha/beta hydrolase, partial [Arenibaculum sp.]|nr:alpha/beta hydrolase [Arenibaculum sp.]
QGLEIAGGMAGAGYRVVAPSRFGYLRTPLPANASAVAQADAHAALLDALAIRRAVVLAASAGARSALQLAIRHPARVSALVLLVPAVDTPAHAVRIEPSAASSLILRIMEAGSDLALWTALHVGRRRLVRFLGVPPELEARAEPAERARISRMMRGVFPVSLRMEGIRNDGRPDEPPPLDRVAAPTLVIGAVDDLFGTFECARYAAGCIPGAGLVVFPTGGHLLVGRQAEIRAVVTGFLAGHRGAPSRSPDMRPRIGTVAPG